MSIASRPLLLSVLLSSLLLGTPQAGAQTPASAPGTVGTPPFATGQGPGYHSPLSAIKPLQERDDIVSWRLLSSVTTKPVKNQLIPVFPDAVKALHRHTIKVQGFMMPLEAGLKQSRFILSSVPTTCPYCVPAGPEGLIEVRSKTPVPYATEAIVMEGQLLVLQDDAMGLYYRLVEAKPAK